MIRRPCFELTFAVKSSNIYRMIVDDVQVVRCSGANDDEIFVAKRSSIRV